MLISFILLIYFNGRSMWADFLTADPAAWRVRVGEHRMFEDDESQIEYSVEKVILHPSRDR